MGSVWDKLPEECWPQILPVMEALGEFYGCDVLDGKALVNTAFPVGRTFRSLTERYQAGEINGRSYAALRDQFMDLIVGRILFGPKPFPKLEGILMDRVRQEWDVLVGTMHRVTFADVERKVYELAKRR